MPTHQAAKSTAPGHQAHFASAKSCLAEFKSFSSCSSLDRGISPIPLLTKCPCTQPELLQARLTAELGVSPQATGKHSNKEPPAASLLRCKTSWQTACGRSRLLRTCWPSRPSLASSSAHKPALYGVERLGPEQAPRREPGRARISALRLPLASAGRRGPAWPTPQCLHATAPCSVAAAACCEPACLPAAVEEGLPWLNSSVRLLYSSPMSTEDSMALLPAVTQAHEQ